MDQTPEEHWRDLSERMLTEISEWRRSHPKAPLRDIEDDVHARTSRLEAPLLQETAHQRTSRSGSGARAQERPACSVWKTPLHARGKRPRKRQGAEGHDITLSRE
jgi:hypothetical protein